MRNMISSIDWADLLTDIILTLLMSLVVMFLFNFAIAPSYGIRHINFSEAFVMKCFGEVLAMKRTKKD